MNKKRFSALALALLMAAVAFASCNNDANESSAPSSNSDAVVSTSDDSGSEPEVSVGPLDHLVDRYTDKEVTFLVNTQTDVSNGYRSIEICPNDEDQKYTYMNDSVERRNRMIEEQLGIKISEIRTTTMTSDITNAINTGSQEFQVVCPWMTDAGPLVASGCFYDLRDYDDVIRFDQPYWDNNANESLSINNKLYFTTGDFSFLSMDVTHCMIFNRDVVAENGLENPYDLVADGKWTLDKMMELSRAVTSDSDGEPGYSYKDNIGLHVNANYSNSFFIGSGGGYEHYVHTADLFDLIVLDLGEYKLFLKTERIVSATVKAVGIDTLEVTNAGKGEVEESVHELVHTVAAKRYFYAYLHALTELEVCY